MTQSTVENRKTVQEIKAQINNLKESTERKETQLEQYRSKRAEIVMNEASTTKNKAKVTSIDSEIKQLKRAIENFPTELKLLEENLATEQARIAQAENDKLLEQQREVAEDIEVLSKNFVTILEKAVGLNQNLVAALSAEAGLAAKTGQQVLGNYCHGSQMSLAMLLELMKSQIDGQHTTPFGAAGVNIRIRL